MISVCIRPKSPHSAWVAPDADVADDVIFEPGAVVYSGARIGPGVRIGAHAVVHARTQVGDQCTIEEGAVLGKRPRLRAESSVVGAHLDPLVIERNVTVCCGAVVYAGAYISAGAIVGDLAQVRERAVLGQRSVVGCGSAVDFGAAVGARVVIQTGCYVTGGSVIEDDVFLGPGVITTNDDAMARHPPSKPLQGPIFRRACRVGGGVVVVPGVVIGEEAFVAAGALVTEDVGQRDVVMGVPGRCVRRVPDEDLIERWYDPQSAGASRVKSRLTSSDSEC